MIVNRQDRIHVDVRALRDFVGRLRKGLDLGQADFNICLVSEAEIVRLNALYRGKRRPTDVLSFPWSEGTGELQRQIISRARLSRAAPRGKKAAPRRIIARTAEFANFLGDIVISTETARRNAHSEGQPVAREIRWLILHGVLHLLGFDHETDSGEMNELELLWRARLKI